MAVEGEHAGRSSASPARARIAVVTVHGVGEHRSGEMSKAIVRQLQQLDGSRYGAFDETPLIIPVDGAALGNPRLSQAPEKPALRILEGFQTNVRPAGMKTDATRPVDVAYSEQLLKGAEDYTSAYETLRRRGRVKSSTVESVDVFELHWSDLSHLGVAIPAVFEEMLQLIVHLAGLGRSASAFAAESVDASERPAWRVFYWLNSISYWLFSTPIVVLNFILFLMSLLLLPAMLLTASISATEPAGSLVLIAYVIEGVVAAGLMVMCGWALYRAAKRILGPPASRPLILLPVLVAAASGFGVFALLHNGPTGVDLPLALAALELPLLALIGNAIVKRYEKSRPGALLLWRVSGVALILWLVLALLATRETSGTSPQSLRWLIEWVAYGVGLPFVALIVFWLALYVVNGLLCIVGLVLAVRHGLLARHSTRAAAALRRTVATCLMSASLPAPVFLAAVLVYWVIWAQIFSSFLPDLSVKADWLRWIYQPVRDIKANGLVDVLVDLSASAAFSIYVVMILVAVVLALLALFPSIWLEIFPFSFPLRSELDPQAHGLANWLNAGYWLLGVAAMFAGVAFFVVFPAGSIIGYFDPDNRLASSLPYLTETVAKIGAVAGGVAVGFVAATKMLIDKVSTGLNRIRVVVDTAADVDNWLHDRPLGATPRLKIFARFAALLTHIKNEHYDRIVIVAHSQGTVVTADFFRYLKFARPHFYKGLPECRLVTAGSPLRQLYALRFPELYGWVNRPYGNDGGPVGPNLADIGFSRWINLFGSGDYVGRYLWAAEGNSSVWTAGTVPAHTAMTGDCCTGPHAHTHYFDPDNRLVAHVIDQAVNDA
jgi:hypothetical protein